MVIETSFKVNADVLRAVMDAPAKVHEGVVTLAKESIVSGLSYINTPGQPDDLRQGQWESVNDGPLDTTIGIKEPSAISVENGISKFNGAPIELHSSVGGTHSVKLTHQNAGKLVEITTKRVARANR